MIRFLARARQTGKVTATRIAEITPDAAMKPPSVAAQRKASTTALARNTWPQRILVADMRWHVSR